jgi:hypothetical protein
VLSTVRDADAGALPAGVPSQVALTAQVAAPVLPPTSTWLPGVHSGTVSSSSNPPSRQRLSEVGFREEALARALWCRCDRFFPEG